MKIVQMSNDKGGAVKNHFIIFTPNATYFQSYTTIIIKTDFDDDNKRRVTLDKNYWNYSRTTSKYRNQFLGETTKETQRKIDSGEYILADLNTGEIK